MPSAAAKKRCRSHTIVTARGARLLLGFTLVELLVVIAIIGVLIALLLPAVQAAREASRRTECMNHQRQIGVGLHGFHDANGHFPVGSLCHTKDGPGCTIPLRIAWSVFLLPYVEEQNTWDAFHVELPYNAVENGPAARQRVAVYLCPSTVNLQYDRVGDAMDDYDGDGVADPGDWYAATDYGGMNGSGNILPLHNGAMIYNEPVSIADITDGTSQTIIVAEDTGRGRQSHGEWAHGHNIFDQSGPINVQQNNEMFSDHPAGVVVLYADGSVHFLAENTSISVLDALCARGDGSVAE